MRVASLIGTASPRPTPATAVLTPTTRASPSASAPPELPGLSAASVWITFSTRRPADPERVGSERPSAETTPAVTVPARPIGLPIATTSWPTRSSSASPSLAGVRSLAWARTSGQVGKGVGADDLGAQLAAVREGRADAVVALGHDVRRGQHVAVGGDRDGAAAALAPPPAGAPGDAQVRHRRPQPLGDARDGARVGVERLRVGKALLVGLRGSGAREIRDQPQPRH